MVFSFVRGTLLVHIMNAKLVFSLPFIVVMMSSLSLLVLARYSSNVLANGIFRVTWFMV